MFLKAPTCGCGHVDDVFAAVNSSLVETLQHHLNNIEPSIQFTVERETNRKMSFLDVTVCHQDRKILHRSANWRNRRILEAWEINTCRNPLNRDDGMHLPHEFLNLALRDRT